MKNEYIIGIDKSLKEIIKDVDLIPLFKSAVSTGATDVMVEDSKGEILYRHSGPVEESVFTIKKPVHIEGEIAGHIIIKGDCKKKGIIEAIGELISDAVKIILNNSFKTIPATETHKTLFNRSYEELLETNRKLRLSDQGTGGLQTPSKKRFKSARRN